MDWYALPTNTFAVSNGCGANVIEFALAVALASIPVNVPEYTTLPLASA